MFDRLRKAFKSTIDKVKEKVSYKELSEQDVSEVLDELFLQLIEADVAYEVAEDIIASVKNTLVGTKVRRGESIETIIIDALKSKLLEVLGGEGPDLVSEAAKRGLGDKPLVIVFLGVNGVGKTTTIAKLAYKMKQAGITPVLAAADTFRAGAQEQLKVHAERLGIPIIQGRYGADPASVAHDAIGYAKARGYRVVLVDTAGRMHVDYDLMGELRKIVRVSKPDFKVLVVDSLTGNDAVEQARKFSEEVGVDTMILTKADADVKGGTAISVTAVTRKPIAYLGVGQRYEDLVRFEPRKFVEELLAG